ncbi:MAG: hypothetical protein ACREBU_04940 [Nitrososphaera sp.]
MTYCRHCAGELESDDLETCPHCGGDLSYTPPPAKTKRKSKKSARQVKVVVNVPQKSPGLAALIALIGAFFGFGGIGHIYVGRVGRGLAVLISGFALYFFIWASAFGTLIGGTLAWARTGLSGFQIGGTVFVALVFAYLGLMIWQILDSRASAKQYNEQTIAEYEQSSVDDVDAETA